MKLNWKSALAPSQWQGPYLDYLPVIAGLLLALGVGYSLAQLTWTLWSGPHYEVPAAPFSAPGPAAVPAQALPEMSALHLFGKFEPPQAPVAPTEIPVTPLNLTLRGVIAADNPASARAIVADQGGKEDYYAINADLPGGAKLKEIRTDRIILTRNNQDEVLRLPRDSAEENIPVAVPVSVTPAAAPPPQPVPEGASAPAPVAPAAAAGSPPVEQNPETLSILRSYRDALHTNPKVLAGVANAEPVTEGNRQLGYRINAGNDASFLTRFGMQAGDIITAVNGVVLDNPAKGLEAVGKLGTANQVNISILRHGQPRTVSFNLNQ